LRAAGVAEQKRRCYHCCRYDFVCSHIMFVFITSLNHGAGIFGRALFRLLKKPYGECRQEQRGQNPHP